MSRPGARICLLVLGIMYLFLPEAPLYAQGIKGTITNQDGQPLAFATVFARNVNDGIPTNQNGYFEDYALLRGGSI